jgi:UDP-N-acetylmuramate: L-alanyl-gamma-D-glutamyl-meso-diaminopimelate ligase
LITSVEFDHADIYRDLDHVKEEFRKLVEGIPRDGTIVAALTHPGVRDVISGAHCRVIGYGVEGEGLDWSCAAMKAGASGTHFDILADEKPISRAFVPLFGNFNVENAIGALAATTALGVPLDAATAALANFKGVKRRQEWRGEERGVAVIDDFAHHPTAVRGSIGALRQRFAGHGADRVIIRSVAEKPIYSATGPIERFFSAEKLVADLGERGVTATSCDGVEEIVERLAAECRSGDVVLCMSNGSFDGIWQRLLDALRDRAETAGR